MTSFDIFDALNKLDLVKKNYPLWWENAGKFDVIIGSFLTQQSKWEKVLTSLENLKSLDLLLPQKIAGADFNILANAISPSGLYNQKAKRLKLFCQNLLENFGNEDNFKQNISRSWLLEQKGVGLETADSILNYYAFFPTMVVDSYTKRLLQKLDFIFETYEEMKEWLEFGMLEKMPQITQDLGIKDYEVFALFHGLIVEFSKTKLDPKALEY